MNELVEHIVKELAGMTAGQRIGVLVDAVQKLEMSGEEREQLSAALLTVLESGAAAEVPDPQGLAPTTSDLMGESRQRHAARNLLSGMGGTWTP